MKQINYEGYNDELWHSGNRKIFKVSGKMDYTSFARRVNVKKHKSTS